MRNIIVLAALAALSACNVPQGGDAEDRQAQATAQAMNAADRETGMPRIVNFAQRKLLKNAYEDMDQTTLTYVYSQGLDGKFVCLGQALGYGVSLGTEFTSPHKVEYHSDSGGGNILLDQADPNMLYMPSSGAATIVDLINPANGEAHTAVIEPNVVTVPFKLPASTVTSPCPSDVDPTKVVDAKETSVATQLK
jgi:hypothetical protein